MKDLLYEERVLKSKQIFEYRLLYNGKNLLIEHRFYDIAEDIFVDWKVLEDCWDSMVIYQRYILKTLNSVDNVN